MTMLETENYIREPLRPKAGAMISSAQAAGADFRLLLQNELIARIQRNPKYSLRAFARHLGIRASALSDMLNRKRTITANMIERLGMALELPLEDIRRHANIAIHAKARRSHVPTAIYELVELDQYAIISDWYHYAILELMKVDGFVADQGWISQALGISRPEANAAVERLERMNLIRCYPDRWEEISTGYTTNIGTAKTSGAARKLQRQILEKSIEALENLPIEVRNHTSMTMAVDPTDLPEAIARITRFRRELCAFLESRPKPKQVYHLSVSLYPVTPVQIQTSKEESISNV